MLGKIRKFISSSYYSIVRSIAFIPSLIIVLLAAAALILISFQGSDISKYILKVFPWVEMSSASLASGIITTLLAGIISLTVFSFSMVMVVLNQAASNFTPKVLAQIVKDRSNQLVLGFYVGTIIYNIILLVNFTKENNEFLIPDIAFFLAIILAIFNIILFVNFIHNVTLSIQVKKVVRSLYSESRAMLHTASLPELQKETNSAKDSTEAHEWVSQFSLESGYFQRVMSDITAYLEEQGIVIKLEVQFGAFVMEGELLYSSSHALSKEVRSNLNNYFVYHEEEIISENPFFGFRQISEIAVKALSPGINDPGTASICIDYLTALLALKAEDDGRSGLYDKKDEIRVIFQRISFEDFLYNCFSSIKTYGAGDPSIIIKLMESLYKLALRDKYQGTHRTLYENHIKALREVAFNKQFDIVDRIAINRYLQKLNNVEGYGLSVPLLDEK